MLLAIASRREELAAKVALSWVVLVICEEKIGPATSGLKANLPLVSWEEGEWATTSTSPSSVPCGVRGGGSSLYSSSKGSFFKDDSPLMITSGVRDSWSMGSSLIWIFCEVENRKGGGGRSGFFTPSERSAALVMLISVLLDKLSQCSNLVWFSQQVSL